MVKLLRANSEYDWITASQILTEVTHRLNELGKPLWTKHQVSITGLKESYSLHELYFIWLTECVGVVFLQGSDPFFWPEETQSNSLYIHKLAIKPRRAGERLGENALSAIFNFASESGKSWVRLDCDNRPELHKFYSNTGFELVDIKKMGSFDVARYQLKVAA